MEAQRRAIAAECKRRGWELVETIEDAGYSAKDLKRPGMQEALRALEAGEAKALVVAKLDRLSRSMLDFAALMATAQKQSWVLVALDCAVDTSTPAGQAMAHRSGDVRAVRAASDRTAHEGCAGGQERLPRRGSAARRQSRQKRFAASSASAHAASRCARSLSRSTPTACRPGKAALS